MTIPESALSERDARMIASKVVERIHAHNEGVDQIGVHLDESGFWITAYLSGRFVTVQVAPGTFRYDDVAKELIVLSKEPVSASRKFVEVTPPAHGVDDKRFIIGGPHGKES